MADLIVVGPGSLYTSLLPNLLVPDLLAALRVSKALKVYVVNIATQRGETSGYQVSDHVAVLEEHVGEALFDVILCNNWYERALPNGVEWVKVDEAALQYPLYPANLVDEEQPWRHDSLKLAQVLIDLLYERTGPLSD